MIRTNSPATPRAVHRTATRNKLRTRTPTPYSASACTIDYQETGREYVDGGREGR